MRRLRYWCAATFAWFFVFYNIERFHQPINLASFVYLVAGLGAVAVCVWPRIHSVSAFWLAIAPIPLVLIMKKSLGYPIGGAHLPITVTETFAIGLTILLVRQVLKSQHELEHSIAGALVSHLQNRSRMFTAGQEELFREIRRARVHNRPLSVLAVSSPDIENGTKLPLLSKQIEDDVFGQYVMARLADFLSAELQDFSIVTRRNNHFVILVPETDRDEAQSLLRALQVAAKEKLELNLQVGLSTFPDEEITMVSLLERAEAEMRNANGSSPGNGAPAVAESANEPTRIHVANSIKRSAQQMSSPSAD